MKLIKTLFFISIILILSGCSTMLTNRPASLILVNGDKIVCEKGLSVIYFPRTTKIECKRAHDLDDIYWPIAAIHEIRDSSGEKILIPEMLK